MSDTTQTVLLILSVLAILSGVYQGIQLIYKMGWEASNLQCEAKIERIHEENQEEIQNIKPGDKVITPSRVCEVVEECASQNGDCKILSCY